MADSLFTLLLEGTTMLKRYMPSRWITFDCFGTLVDWNSGFSALLRSIAAERTPELIRAYHHFERLLEQERPHQLYKTVLKRGLTEAAQVAGIKLHPSQTDVLPQQWGSLPVFGDVEPALSELRADNWKLAVLTNCDEDLFARTHARFRAPFDLVVTAERVADYKPALSHFRYFSRVSGVDETQWIHVACSQFHDLGPARQLGIKSIWLDREQTGEDPKVATLRISNAAELPAAIKRLSLTRP
jgi:2-haloacid dehalogenase